MKNFIKKILLCIGLIPMIWFGYCMYRGFKISKL